MDIPRNIEKVPHVAENDILPVNQFRNIPGCPTHFEKGRVVAGI